MNKDTYLVRRVSCIYRLEDGRDPETCEDCNFFNGFTKDESGEIISVDCLRNEIGQVRGHVTRFETLEYEYTSRMYDEEKDGPLSEAYGYCEKCCFNKTLSNGNDVCLLRCGVPSNDATNFICYEGEIWEKKELTEEDY